jgi:tetratricopeptide (TPR) repeat protein
MFCMKWLICCLLCSPALDAADFSLARREFLRALLAQQQVDSEAQQIHLRRAQAADPGSLVLTQRVADMAMQQGDIKAASRLYRDLAKQRQDLLAAQFLYTDFLRAQGHDDDFALNLATKHLESLQHQYPAHPEVTERLLRLYQQRGWREKSEALFQSYQAHPQADPRIAQSFARLLRDQDDQQSRAQLDAMYRERFSLTPQDAQLARDAAEHFRQSGRIDEAITTLLAHVRAAPSSLDLRVRLGILQLAHQQTANGEKTLLDAISIDPTLVVAHQALAKLYQQQRQPKRARKHRSEMLQLRGGDAREFAQLSEEYLQSKEFQPACSLLEKAVHRYPEDRDLLYLSGIAHELARSPAPKVLHFFQRAEKIPSDCPPSPRYQYHSAIAHWQSGDKEAAEQRLRAAIKQYPAEAKEETITALRLLASWWQEQGKHPSAAQALLRRAEMLASPE